VQAKRIGYWITTTLIVLVMTAGGVFDLRAPPEIVEQFTALGYPVYMLTILGVFKLAGALVIVAPRLPRLKEWAYAGVMIDLVGATASHAFVGDSVGKIAFPPIVLAVSLTSWWLRPESRRLAGPSDQPAASPAPELQGQTAAG